MKSLNNIVKDVGKTYYKLFNKEYKTKIINFNELLILINSEVYDPAEDTFQLIEAIDIKKDYKVFEIGTGCGIIALECAKREADVISSDINPNAVKLAKYNYKQKFDFKSWFLSNYRWNRRHWNKFRVKWHNYSRYGNNQLFKSYTVVQ